MSDWTLTIGDGPWEVDTCGCGFGLGDATENFPNREDAEAYMRYCEGNSDRSVIAFRDPSGEDVPGTFDRNGCLLI